MKNPPAKKKSGQAIIFLLVVMVIGLFAVIWNYDLHRVITAKIKIRDVQPMAIDDEINREARRMIQKNKLVVPE